MNHGANGLNHRERSLALENVAPHINTRRSILNCPVGHFERGLLGKFLSTGNHNRDRTGRSDARESWFTVIGLYRVRPDLGAYACGKAQVFRVSYEFLPNTRYAERGYAVAITRIHYL